MRPMLCTSQLETCVFGVRVPCLDHIHRTLRPRISKEGSLVMARLDFATVQNDFAVFIDDH